VFIAGSKMQRALVYLIPSALREKRRRHLELSTANCLKWVSQERKRGEVS